MTTLDLRSWGPSTTGARGLVSTDDETYTGKHRKPGMRTLSLLRMAYRPRHRTL